MTTGRQAIVLVESAARRIRAATAHWGTLALAASEADQLVGVLGAGERDSTRYDLSRDELAGHVLSHVDPSGGSGIWYHARPELNACHALLMTRPGQAISTGYFQK